MRLALLMAWNEVVQLSRIRTVILMLLGLPLLLIFLLGNALDSDYKPVQVSVYTGNEGQLSEAAKQYFASPELASYVDPLIRNSEDQVLEDIKSGKSDYGLTVVDGTLHYYPGKFAERNLITESVFNRFVADIDVRQSVAIVLPQLSQDQIANSAQSATSSKLVQIGNLVTGDNADFSNFSALQYYSVAYLVMFLLYSGMSGAISITEEREKGTLLRLYAMPVSLNAMLAGKLLGVLFFAIIQSAIIVAFTKWIYGVDWGNSYGGIALVCVLVSMATVSFALLLTSIIRSRRAIESIFSLLIMVMTFLSGGMIADLGPSLNEIGKFTINHWANEALRRMMAGGSLLESWQFVVILGSITFVLLSLSLVRFKKAVAL
ncbi:ABC transporter permease [Cohnella sp. WQ 127256]|uniref:ABC transporter permease n=1 Tax=Cohnella sp. WQ 127256 TaxID=2938790 RepID=UPI00211816BD|nr:ABC transporter permease [Cohnella sp. WQ 127256]